MARPKEYDEREVVAKAVELFQRKGYDAASVRDLLEATRLSSSSLYAAFGGKEQLFLKALKAHAEVERHTFRSQLTAPGGLRNNVHAVFSGLIELLIHPEDNPSLTLRAAVELGSSMPPVLAVLTKYIQELTQMFATLLQEAHDRGEIHLRFPATDLAHYLLFSAYNLGVVARVGATKDQLERYARIALSALDHPDAQGGTPAHPEGAPA